MNHQQRIFLLLTGLLLLSSCTAGQRAMPAPEALATVGEIVRLTLTAAAPLPTALPVTQPPTLSIPTPTATPAPTQTASPTPTPDPTARRDPEVVPSLPALEAGLVTHGRRDQKRVALTFDACEMPGYPAGYDAAIIAILNDKQAPATLFLGGLWMENHPDQARQLGANPLFEIGSHSYSHPDFSKISAAQMNAEIERTQAIAWRLAGRLPRLFRLPGGTYTDEALNVIAAHGLTTIQWEVVTGDPDPNITAEDMLREVRFKAQNGSIIIMHMNGRGWHTPEALPDMIEWLRAQGYALVTVSELLK